MRNERTRAGTVPTAEVLVGGEDPHTPLFEVPVPSEDLAGAPAEPIEGLHEDDGGATGQRRVDHPPIVLPESRPLNLRYCTVMPNPQASGHELWALAEKRSRPICSSRALERSSDSADLFEPPSLISAET